MPHNSRPDQSVRGRRSPQAAAPAQESSAADPAPESPKRGRGRRRAVTRRRLIDYPRAAKRGPRRWIPSPRQLAVLVFGPLLLLAATCAVLYANVTIPDPDQDVTRQATVVTYADGTVMGTIGVTSRRNVPLSQVPLTVRHAVLAAEDRDFYQESGVSPQGIVRAIVADVQGKPLQGGSTITQQYVKNAFLNSSRTMARKLDELFISIKLDHERSKDQILQDYLNSIYFGRGAYGIEAAAQAYFGRDVNALDVSQAAYLGAIIQAPSSYDPVARPEVLPVIKDRWRYVVNGMVSSGWLSADQARRLAFPRLQPVQQHPSGDQAPYLMALATGELNANGISEQQIATGGLRVRTTVQRPAEQKAVQAVRDKVLSQLSAGRAVDADVRVGFAAVRPSDGAIIAIYGGRDFNHREFNDATQSAVPTGRIFKPLVAAGILDTDDGPLTADLDDRAFSPDSTALDTDDHKKQVQAIRAAVVRLGIPDKSLGLSSTDGLLTGDVSPHVLDIAGAYAALAAHGMRTAPHLLADVSDAHGRTLYRAQSRPTRALDQDAAQRTDAMLCRATVLADPDHAPAPWVFGGTRDCGVNGESLSDGSAWSVGASDQLATAVALFRDGPDLKPDPRSRSLAGVAGQQTVKGDGLPAQTRAAFLTALRS
ncbi:transglycosylase domain-containing protein [Streptantibioticus rubrisoli]|uniref:Penicillin-binding protein n=1 Tax=Streptantibioticus rubrisoli TaxID=1387313 RepID=A0ABT1PID4_9ACTN|nr:transglycosylase domain-containing protein [Streptantibioticus rubrisoli]MCQ4045125.1 penicillin-binding protein [Streptantibioticus rubrisoli]